MTVRTAPYLHGRRVASADLLDSSSSCWCLWAQCPPNLEASKQCSAACQLAPCACLIPTSVADGFVLYVGTEFGIAACLNACTWFLLAQMFSMLYAALTVHCDTP